MTPVYNVEKYLPHCLDTVINQTYDNFELILVDDGSTDSCGRICDEYAAKDSRIKVFHKPNGGLFHTRRFALERITGDYCVFLDSDDYIALDMLEKLAAYIEKSKAECIIYGCHWLRPEGTVDVTCDKKLMNRIVTDKRELYNIIFNNDEYNAIWRKCVKASVFDGRDYSFDFHIRNGEDIVQTIEIVENSRTVLFVPDMLYYYRFNSSSMTHTNKYSHYRANFDVERRIFSFLRRSDAWKKKDYDRFRNRKLDEFVIIMKHICHTDDSIKEKAESLESIRDNDVYVDYLEQGYNSVKAIPGSRITSTAGRLFNRIIISLLNARKFRTVAVILTSAYKIALFAGKRKK